MTEQEKIETEAIKYVKETTLYGEENAPLGSSAKSYFETEKRCFIAGVNSKISKEILNKKTTLKEQHEQAVNRYIEKFVKKHGYEFTDWVADEVGGIAVFIEQYYLNFSDIKYDIDNKVKKGLIFRHQEDSVEHHLTVNQVETINFKSYVMGLRYEHLKTCKK